MRRTPRWQRSSTAVPSTEPQDGKRTTNEPQTIHKRSANDPRNDPHTEKPLFFYGVWRSTDDPAAIHKRSTDVFAALSFPAQLAPGKTACVHLVGQGFLLNWHRHQHSFDVYLEPHPETVYRLPRGDHRDMASCYFFVHLFKGSDGNSPVHNIMP